MFEFGDELIIESFKIPWLIWIQLVVMILLVLLLYFGFSVLDLSNNSTSQGPVGSSSHVNLPSNSIRILQHRNLNQHTKGENEASTSREIRADESQEREGSAEKDATTFKFCVRTEHPCNYFGLAKQAFLKCLGFDSDRDNCNMRRHAKEEGRCYINFRFLRCTKVQVLERVDAARYFKVYIASHMTDF